MGSTREEKKRDQSPISIALFVGAAVFWIVWLLRSLSTAFAMATAAALVTWGTSTWLQSEQKITFQGAVSTTLSRASERNYKFHEKELIPLLAAVLVWGVSKFLVGQFLGVMVGGMAGCILYNRFEEKERMRLEEEKRKLEEEERRKKKIEQVVSGVLGFGAAAGAAALAAWGISKAINDGYSGDSSGGYRCSDEEEEKDKMMKAPGRDYVMPRKDFERNPSQYFRDLRGKGMN